MTFRTGFGDVERVRFECVGPLMTKQSFKEECDINTIMAQYENTGLVTHVKEHQGNYLDVAFGFDFHESMRHGLTCAARPMSADEVFCRPLRFTSSFACRNSRAF